jgi:Tfp pilus assembly protein PilO
MRVFILSLVVAAVLATGWAFTLNAFQKTTAEAQSTDAVRLDQKEAVNLYGREPVVPTAPTKK